MLKKSLVSIGYVAIMLCLGFAIYYYFLSPANVQYSLGPHHEKLTTKEFFDAKLPDINGMDQALNQYKGKVIVLNFWATWCPPCREEMPDLSKLHQEYQNKNVVVLGVAIDELGLVKEFAQSTPVSYPLFAAEIDGMALGNNLGNDKGVLPYTVIINAEGSVVKTYFGRISEPLLKMTLNTLLPH